MEEVIFTKFNTKEMEKFINGKMNEMSVNDAYLMYMGFKSFATIFREYTKDKYGSCKREEDINQYISIMQDNLLKRLNKIK